ncbi:sulfotransferase family protein [Pleomorphovibrio marinus]|uniref:sulfotransferase family protein n=1 Tax=Pleomorphovibrio marinus TaxID=2164132 RepID=UPI000E0BDC1B|nr:sulfotransferase domain-containing protein [Pleomorphovibrio marinus]
MKIRKPNLFIIGSVKCGTTSLFNFLQESEDVFFPKQKEPHFFIQNFQCFPFSGPDDLCFYERYAKNIEEYEKLFLNAGNNKIVGEASTMYLSVPSTAHRIKEYNPEAKIIAVIRDPVSRAYSHFLHHVRDGTAFTKDFSKWIEMEESGKLNDWAPHRRLIEIGMYGKHLRQYFDCFDRTQILVIKFDDLIGSPSSTLINVCEFLNISSKIARIKLQKHNASGMPTNPAFHNAYLGSLRFIRRNLPWLSYSPLGKLRKKFDQYYRNKFLSKPVLQGELKSKLAEIYSHDIDITESITGLDLSNWKIK